MELHERLTTMTRTIVTGPAGADPFAGLKNTVHLRVIGDLGPQLFNVSTDPAVLRERPQVQQTRQKVLQSTCP